MNRSRGWASVCVLAALSAAPAQATVVIDTVPVGNPGNTGELSGSGAGGFGPDRTCGAVDYAYNIGKYEVTTGQYTEFLNAVAATDTYGLYNPAMWIDLFGFACRIERSGSAGSYTYRVAPDAANRPVNFVGWDDAARFANWLHNGQPTGPQGLNTTEDGSYFLNGAITREALLAVSREPDATWVIPTEDEWYKAAYHKNDGVTDHYFDYPTGSNTRPGRDLNDLSGNNANFHDGSTIPIDPPYYTTIAGEFQNSDSPYGTFDQGGNLWEWNETAIGQKRGIRGSAFLMSSDYLHAAERGGSDPTSDDACHGMRIALVPEPATLMILALASVGVLRTRRA